MRTLKHLLCLLLLAPAWLLAAEPVTRSDANLAGVYLLNSGPRELGAELLLSQLQLKESGEFEWLLLHGDMHQFAAGRWERSGKQVTLTSVQSAPVFRMLDDDDYHGTEPFEPGRWSANVGEQSASQVAQVEVQFEARSGKTASAVAQPNGYATVTMPAKESWARAGLRLAGREAPWQWFALTPQRAEARLAGFALTNIAGAFKAPFSTMTLEVTADGLKIVGEGGLRGTYVKQ